MSASLKPQPATTAWTWSAGEMARAKQLRGEGHTYGSIATVLRREFQARRSSEGVRKLFASLPQRDQEAAEPKEQRVVSICTAPPQGTPTGRGWVWTTREIERAKQLCAEGVTHRVVAQVLTQEFGTARTKRSVWNFLKRLHDGLDPGSATRERMLQDQVAATANSNTVRRSCLMCRGAFESEGAHNRVCAGCKRTERWW